MVVNIELITFRQIDASSLLDLGIGDNLPLKNIVARPYHLKCQVPFMAA